MNLRVTLRRLDNSVEDLTISAEPGTTIGDIAAAIVRCDPCASYPEADYPAGEVTLQAVSLAGGGSYEILDPDETLTEVSLASGVEIAVVQTRIATRTPVAFVDLRSGTAHESRIEIPRGATTIGRGRGNDIDLDDPLVSRRHARLHVGVERIELVDVNSAHGLRVRDRPVPRLDLHTGETVLLGGTRVRAGFLPGRPRGCTRVAEVVVTPSPSVTPRYRGSDLQRVEPPAPTDPHPFSWIALLAPLLLGTALFFATRSPLSILFVAVSPLMMLGTWLTARSQRRRAERLDRERFEQRLEHLTDRLTRERDMESEARRAESPSLSEIYHGVLAEDPVLWRLRPEHWSFLHLRLGSGRVRSRTTVAPPTTPDRAAPSDLQRVNAVVERFATLPDLPIVESLVDAGALGLSGTRAATAPYVRGLVAQLAGTRTPADTVICGILGRAWSEELAPTKWLPHTSGDERIFAGTPLAGDAAAAARLVSCLEEILAQRAAPHPVTRSRLGAVDETDAAMVTGASAGARSQPTRHTEDPLPAIVVLISDDAPVARSRLIHLLECAPGHGVYPVWIATHRSRIPAACRTFVELGERGADIGFVRLGTSIVDAAVEGLSLAEYERFARALAAYRDAGATAATSADVPDAISLTALIGDDVATDTGAVVDRWRQNGSLPAAHRPDSTHPGSLRALVGQSADGAMHLDLRAHGPHALVGGTTGSGKSEFLQTWVLGMAAEYSPQRVAFLFVDYKGGAAFAECTRLPHSVGLVTDLTPHLVRRALTSLRAELRYRETLLAAHGAKDIIDLEQRADPAAPAPPALVIVIDEFAALTSEVPGFMDGIIDLAQRGRSLGIHLIMATQRPAGVITDKLRANTALRVALRMADGADSDDVIGERIAATFAPHLPGRAAVTTGPGRPTLFQTAYAGGWTPPGKQTVSVRIESFGASSGEAWTPRQPERPIPQRERGPTDLQRMVQTMTAAARNAGISAPRRPWLDELDRAYDLAHLPQRADRQLAFGVVDEPQQQRQRTLFFEPDEAGHLAVFGTSGSGKSTTLRSLAVAAGCSESGDPVDVYALDFGAGGLRMLECLPHVGAVIPAGATDRVRRLFTMLKLEIARRSAAFAAVNAGTLTDYRVLAERPGERRILLLIDAFPAFRAEYEGVPGRSESYDTFMQLLADGRSIGIHVALAAERAHALTAAQHALIQQRVVLRLTDADAYAMLSAPRDVLDQHAPPGRALVDGFEAQIAVAGGSPRMDEQASALAAVAAELVRRGRPAAPEVLALPERYRLEELPERVEAHPPLGLLESTLAPVGFAPTGLFVVAGGPGSGKTSTMLTLARALRRADAVDRCVLLALHRSRLAAEFPWDGLAYDAESARSLLTRITRHNGAGERFAVFVERAIDFSASPVETELSELVGRAKHGECLVVAEGDTHDWNVGFGIMRSLKSSRRGVVLAPEAHDGEIVFGMHLPRTSRGEFPPGRAVYAVSGRAFTVQLPLSGSLADDESALSLV